MDPADDPAASRRMCWSDSQHHGTRVRPARCAAPHHRLRRGGPASAGCGRRRFRSAARGDARPGRRIGLRQVDDRVVDPAPGAAARPDRRRTRPLQGARPVDAAGTGDARRARRRNRARLPGADDGAEPGVHRRGPDRRGDARAPPGHADRGPAPGDRTARRGARPRTRAPGARLPASALRRNATAGPHRDGACVPAVARHRRRAHDGPRCDHPGSRSSTCLPRCALRSSSRWC